MRRVAIHQPNFIPWLGLFDRIARVDRFVFFDHVQALRGKSWLTRNRLLNNGEPRWMTVPVQRSGKGLQRVSEVLIVPGPAFPDKQLRTLDIEYGHHPFYAETAALVHRIFTAGHESVAELNTQFTRGTCAALGISAEFVSSTQLMADDEGLRTAAGNDLVLRTCVAAGGDAYLSGDGCMDFIDPDAFGAAGVSFAFQEFRHPVYDQWRRTDFVSHLSVIDALCNLGFAGVRDLLDVPASDP